VIRRRALLPLALLPTMAAAGGEELPSGADLYAAHCTGCHTTAIHVRSKRIVHSLEELQNRVRQCEQLAEAGWFDEEVEAVVKYLNDSFYKLAPGRD
jgi:mono/diheme cytochrome c family protein